MSFWNFLKSYVISAFQDILPHLEGQTDRMGKFIILFLIFPKGITDALYPVVMISCLTVIMDYSPSTILIINLASESEAFILQVLN